MQRIKSNERKWYLKRCSGSKGLKRKNMNQKKKEANERRRRCVKKKRAGGKQDEHQGKREEKERMKWSLQRKINALYVRLFVAIN